MENCPVCDAMLLNDREDSYIHTIPDQGTCPFTGAKMSDEAWGALKVLQERNDKLDALEGAGVDNWEGYGDAMQALGDEG